MRRLVCVLLAAAGVAVATTPFVPPVAAQPPPVSVDGVWQTDGYGEVLAIAGTRLSVYQVTAVSCVLAQQGRRVATTDGAARFVVPGDDAVTVDPVRQDIAVEHLESAVSSRLLTRRTVRSEICSHETPRDPLSTFDTLWATFAENYPFFALHGIDWTAVRDRYRPMVDEHTTPQQLFQIFERMLAPLHDAHVAVLGPDGQVFVRLRAGTLLPTADLDERLRTLVTGTDLAGLGLPASALTDYANGRIAFAQLPGGIGYLRVSGFAGYTRADTETANRTALIAALDQVFTATRVASWHGLMIDLRINGGGSDALALDLTQRLIDQPEFAYAKRYWTGDSWSRAQPVVVSPAAAPTYAGPLALLVSGSTLSAGETFTQSLLARPTAPVLVGQPTQGVFSDTLTRLLPNGWLVTLPNEQYRTRGGVAFDGRGIPPTIARRLTLDGPSDPLFTTAYTGLS